jgi:hypothetical protein
MSAAVSPMLCAKRRRAHRCTQFISRFEPDSWTRHAARYRSRFVLALYRPLQPTLHDVGDALQGVADEGDSDLDLGTIRLDENKTNDPRMWALDTSVTRALKAW